MISALYILDLKGKIIISRDYRGDISINYVERFVTKILEEEESSLKPVFEEDGVSFIYIKHNNLYVLAVSQMNSDAALVILFLYKLIEVFKEYFKEVEEESIRDNFVITYELLDEMMDFGYPQATEAALLKEYILQKSHELHKALVRVPPAVTGAVSWRSENIKYPKNEVFIDVIEKVNMLVASNGTLLRSEIVGQILIKSKLSGMPELRLGLNDRVQFDTSKREVRDPNASNANANATTLKRAIEMEDVTFHQCVRLNKFETERIISFIPPDGDFELMSYRLSTSIRPLIWIEAVIDAHAHSRVEYFIKAKSQFKPRSTANNVEIVIPVPPDADSPKFRASIGSVKYVPERNALVWSIRQFQGGKEFMLRAHFGLPSLTNEEEEKQKRPITVNFEIPYFTVSGIQVRYLKILEKTGYRALPWVRYITRAGEYQIRTN